MAPAGGDFSSLYAFVVGERGHPFHRHAGPRVFTAVAGSSGAQLRFSGLPVVADSAEFLRSVQCVDIPPDALFTVRFGSETWHQFVPRAPGHAALFALSCHTNELAGALLPELRAQVAAGVASIPALTELLPEAVQSAVAQHDFASNPARALSFTAPTRSLAGRACASIRRRAGALRVALRRRVAGFIEDGLALRPVRAIDVPADSMQRLQFDAAPYHDDCFAVRLAAAELPNGSPAAILAMVLDAFLEHRPTSVSLMMRVRNLLVRPLGLRTSPLGCPVSSLLGSSTCQFAGRFPVHGQQSNERLAEVVLGADDKHLKFRSCVAVRIDADGNALITLGTRVVVRNAFGRFYMAVIDRVHRHYVTPTLLRTAVNGALSLPAGLALRNG